MLGIKRYKASYKNLEVKTSEKKNTQNYKKFPESFRNFESIFAYWGKVQKSKIRNIHISNFCDSSHTDVKQKQCKLEETFVADVSQETHSAPRNSPLKICFWCSILRYIIPASVLTVYIHSKKWLLTLTEFSLLILGL